MPPPLLSARAVPGAQGSALDGACRRADASTGSSSVRRAAPKRSRHTPLTSAAMSFTTTTFFKLLVLATLALQNSGITLVTRYSRGVLQEQYAPITTVIVSELVKLVISVVVIHHSNSYDVSKTVQRVVHDIRFSLPMAVPGAIYLVQNLLTYVGLGALDGSTYAILVQLKLLTTAVFAVLMLNKKLWSYQWRALFLLFVGVVLVQLKPPTNMPASVEGGWLGMSAEAATGTAAVLGVAVLSGLAGVYFEWMLKTSAAFNMWDRNVQLCFYGLLLSPLPILFSATERQFFSTHSFYYGWSTVTVLVVLLASAGGLLVSMAVAYTDNIMKNFATSAAIMLTGLVSWLVFGDLQPSAVWLCGMCCVLLAVFNYSEDVKALGRLMGLVDAVEVAAAETGWSGNGSGGEERGRLLKVEGGNEKVSDPDERTLPLPGQQR